MTRFRDLCSDCGQPKHGNVCEVTRSKNAAIKDLSTKLGNVEHKLVKEWKTRLERDHENAALTNEKADLRAALRSAINLAAELHNDCDAGWEFCECCIAKSLRKLSGVLACTATAHRASFDPTTKHDGSEEACVECHSAS